MAAPASSPPRPAWLLSATAVLLCAAAITSGSAHLAGIGEMEVVAAIAGVLALTMTAAVTLRAERDWLNPLLILIATGLLRIGVPSLVLLWSDPPRSFRLFPIRSEAWDLGRSLAVVGLASIAFGWLLLPGATARLGGVAAQVLQRRLRLDARTLAVGLVCMALGLAACLVFLRLNYSTSAADVIASGTIRKGAERVEGTSRYGFLTVWLLTCGSLVVSGYLLLVRRAHWTVGLLPGVAAAVVLSIFGGRVVAMTPLVYACFVLWYRSDRSRLSMLRVAAVGALSAVVFAAYAVSVAYYRTGQVATRAFTSAGLSFYAENTLWYEAGMLHPYALAAHFPAGVMEGSTLPLTTGLAGSMLGVDEGVRPGQYMVEEFLGKRRRTWGFHTGLPVDIYMNYGVAAVVLVGALFGMLMRAAYGGFRAYRRSPAVVMLYALLPWYFLWIFYEQIVGALNIVFVPLPIILGMLLAAELLPRRYPRAAAEAPMPPPGLGSAPA